MRKKKEKTDWCDRASWRRRRRLKEEELSHMDLVKTRKTRWVLVSWILGACGIGLALACFGLLGLESIGLVALTDFVQGLNLVRSIGHVKIHVTA